MKQEISIDKEVYEKCPWIRLGCLYFEAAVLKSNDQFWDDMHELYLPEIRSSIEGKSWSQIEGVAASRQVYKLFGRDPGRYRVSSEALMRRVRRNDELYHINSVVDVNNLISLESGLSVGSYDLDQIHGSIVLKKAGENEGYEAIGKGFLDMSNLLCLKDDEGLFGSSLSDSLRTSVTESSRHILTVIYGFDAQTDMNELLEKSRKAFEKYASAEHIETAVIGGR